MKNLEKTSACAGSVMVVVMLLCAVLMLASAAMAVLASNATFRMRRLVLSSQALHIAEAGVADMIGRLSEDYDAWRDSTTAAPFGGGSYHVVAMSTTSDGVIIRSEGTLGSVSRVAAVELLGTDRNRNDALFALDGAILSGGDVRFRTAAFTIRGNVHSNAKITSSNGAQNGDLFAGLTDDSPATITAVESIGDLQGTHVPNANARELPEFNFDSYRELAQNGGIYLEGSQTLSNWNATPGNGVVYVNGNVRISNNSSLVGTLVANGDITLENNFSQISYAAGMPALQATGNVTMANRGQISGLVYAGVNVYIANNVDVLGGIISVGFTDVANHSDIYHPSDMPDWDPLQPTVPPEVIIGGWLL
ncbi:MAG: hypothetical protein ACNA71_04760 [Kiritimatiellia bacterium]